MLDAAPPVQRDLNPVAVANLAKDVYEREAHHTKEVGMRLARQRDPAYLRLLERLAEAADASAEAEHGRTRRADRNLAQRAEGITVQGFREAYACADRGTPNIAFAWLYGAVAVWGGWTVR